jgi:ubiquinone biosynthesis protein
MLDPSLIPTRLLYPAERPPVEVVKVQAPPRFPAARGCYRLLGWAMRGLILRVTARKSAYSEQARRLRLLFDELGGFWIKLGQFISLRRDLFSPELCNELSMLQDRAAGFPFDVAKRIAEAELEAPLSEVFDAFEEKPFAAASIGQVHKAHLRYEDIWVAVKVQRPFVAEVIARELTFFRWIVSLLEALSIRPHARWRDGYRELKHILQEEVDYRFEASSIRRIRRTLRRHNIFVPKVFSRYSSRRLLVMEFIEGALMTDYLHLMKTDPGRLAVWLAENNIDLRQIAHRLWLSLLRQILEDNLYHGDLHPGNIILLRDSRIALIDCGTVGSLDLDYLQKYRLFSRALWELDYDKAADMCFLLCASVPIKDLERAKEDLIWVLHAWSSRTFVKQLPYEEKSVANCWQVCNEVFLRYQCTFEWGIFRVIRAINTLDASLMYLHPEVNYTKLGQQYVRKAQQRALRRFGTRGSLRKLLENFTIAAELPGKISELTFFTTGVARKQAKVFEGATSKVANLFAVLFNNLKLVCVLTGIGILLVLLDRHAPAIVAPIMKGIVRRIVRAAPAFESDTWLLLLAVDAYLAWILGKLGQRFGRHEVERARTAVNA